MWAHQSCGVRSARGRQTRRRALSLFRAAGQRADVEEGGVLLQARGPGAPRRLRYSPLGTSPWGSAWPLQKARDPNSQTQAPSPCVQRVSCELRHLYYGGWSCHRRNNETYRDSPRVGAIWLASLSLSDTKEDNAILPDLTRLFSSRSCKHPGC